MIFKDGGIESVSSINDLGYSFTDTKYVKHVEMPTLCIINNESYDDTNLYIYNDRGTSTLYKLLLHVIV